MRTHSNRLLVNASWLIKLRWVAVIGQFVSVWITWWLLGIDLPVIAVIVFILLLTACSNLILKYWFERWQRFSVQDHLPWDLILGLVLVMDMLSLTTLLYVTGGSNNPFALFFFVNVSLCALVLNRRWAWAINGLTIFCYAGLMVSHIDLEPLSFGLSKLQDPAQISLQHVGLLLAFTTCSSVIVYFMTRLTDEVRENQLRVRRAEMQQARAEKIEALGTLAAGTAHELATPLSTIAIVAKEVEQAIKQLPMDTPGSEEIVDDVQLIRSQLERCRNIIDRMASHAGETIGESIEPVSLVQLAEACLDGMIQADRIELSLTKDADQSIVHVPLDGLSQAIRGLLQNALDADPSNRAIKFSVSREGSFWRWRIQDQGSGMTSEQLARVSEPFFTTKAPGKGMGLGVFLAQNLIQRLDGRIEFESQPLQGTCVSVWLPVSSNS